jgi:hypothetical protein
MRQVNIDEELAQLEFAKRAAKKFAKNGQLATYADGDLEPGCLLALRWGLGEDCVLVVKLDEKHIPTNFANLVKQFL